MDFYLEVFKLVKELERTQWEESRNTIPNVPILTRQDLQKIPVDKTKPHSNTSGSTGEPVCVQKTMGQLIWYHATNIRELQWKKWDPSKKIAVITAPIKEESVVKWSVNPLLYKEGTCYIHPTKGDLQSFLDRVNPDYLHSYPSIINGLNTTGIQVKSTGERGGTNYSSEEVGTIALECPDNPEVYHVMENIIVEIDYDNNIIITDICHPYIKRYMIGDKGEFATCHCGRKLQTLKKDVIGRVRNMVKYPDGTKAWPLFGTIYLRNIVDIKRVQAIQESLTDITLKVQGEIPDNLVPDVIKLVQECLKYEFNIKIEQVNGFPEGKFEEFVCKI